MKYRNNLEKVSGKKYYASILKGSFKDGEKYYIGCYNRTNGDDCFLFGNGTGPNVFDTIDAAIDAIPAALNGSTTSEFHESVETISVSEFLKKIKKSPMTPAERQAKRKRKLTESALDKDVILACLGGYLGKLDSGEIDKDSFINEIRQLKESYRP